MRAFCCCSAGRPELIKKTLTTLIRACLPPTILHVVVPHDEVETYKKSLEDYTFVTILGAERGLVKQRMAFRSHVPVNTEIVFIDDDITAIKIKNEGNLSHCTDINAVADHIFKRIDLLGGVYPIINKNWMSETISEPAFCVGALYFCKNDPRLKEWDEGDSVEDWGRLLGEIKEGRAVRRFNWIGVQTKYFNSNGGIPSVGRVEKRESQLDSLVNIYKPIVKMIMKRNGLADLKLKEQTKNPDSYAGFS